MEETNPEHGERKDIVSLSQRESLLRSNPGFVGWNLSAISELVGLMREVYVNEGEIIVAEGSVVDSIYIIVNGSAEVSKKVVHKGKNSFTLLSVLNVGESIGLIEGRLFSTSGLRTASVIANTDCLLLKINLVEFQEFLKRHPQLSESLKASLNETIKMQCIKQAEPFAELSNERIAWIAPLVKEKTVKAGDYIFSENEIADSCYMIYDGEVEIFTTGTDGQKKVLVTLESGAFFGESVLLQSGKRQATARASRDSQLLVLEREVLAELMAEEPMSLGALDAMLIQRKHPIRNEHVIYQHKKSSDGETLTILKDTVRNKYFQLNEKGWLIWQQLNGKHAVPEIAANLRFELGEENQEFLLDLINQLAKKGFVFFDIINMHDTEETVEHEDEGFLSRWRKVYFIKHADKLSGQLYRLIGRYFINLPLFIFYIPIILAGLAFFILNFNHVLINLHHESGFISALIFSLPLTMFFRLFNPLVKAMMIKRFKHDVPNIGLCWQVIGPTMTIDTSDLMLSPKKQQIMVRMAGFLADLTVAGLLSLYFFYVNESLLIWFTVLFLYLSLLRSCDPFLNIDGYQLLSDLLESFRLREIALSWIAHQPAALYKHKRFLKFTNLALFFWSYTLIYFLVNLSVFYLIIQSLLQILRPYKALNLPLIATITVLYLIEIVMEYRRNVIVEQLLKQYNNLL